jgi:predicted DNA-binding protein with PD1-like motif
VKWQSTRYGYALRLDAGEEIVATLTAFAAERGIRAGAFSGIGAAGDCELGFFARDSGTYVRRVFEREYEIGSLTGNFSELDGRPFPHCHVVLGDDSFAAFTGHLFRGVVTVTCEIHVVTDPDVLQRMPRPDLGFNPLEPRGG